MLAAVYDDFDQRIGNPLPAIMDGLSRYETAAGSLEIDFKALFRALKEKTGVPAAIAHPKTP